MTRPRAIVFDLFDTLVDLHWDRLPVVELGGRQLHGTHAALHEAARPWVDLPFDEFLAALQHSDRALAETTYRIDRELETSARFRGLAERLGVGAEAFVERLSDTHMSLLKTTAVHVPEHAELLGRLARQVPLGLCSNFSHSATALAVLDAAGLLEFLDPIVISDQNGFRKPRVEIFREVLERLDLPADAVLHVGDRLDADVGGGAGAGMRTAWLTRRVADTDAARAKHDGPEPDHVFADLSELVAWFESDPTRDAST
jgi:HAD superfamily hydrolase (TIGR01549 family)